MAMKIRTHSHTHTVEQITSQLNNILNIFKYKLNILKYLIFFFFCWNIIHSLGLPRWCSWSCSDPCRSQLVVQVMQWSASANAEDMKLGFNPWVRKTSSWRRAWQPTPVFLPRVSIDRGAWQATVHGVTKSRTRLKRLSTHACTLFHWLLVYL